VKTVVFGQQKGFFINKAMHEEKDED